MPETAILGYKIPYSPWKCNNQASRHVIHLKASSIQGWRHIKAVRGAGVRIRRTYSVTFIHNCVQNYAAFVILYPVVYSG